MHADAVDFRELSAGKARRRVVTATALLVGILVALGWFEDTVTLAASEQEMIRQEEENLAHVRSDISDVSKGLANFTCPGDVATVLEARADAVAATTKQSSYAGLNRRGGYHRLATLQESHAALTREFINLCDQYLAKAKNCR